MAKKSDDQGMVNGDPTEGGDIYIFRPPTDSREITYRKVPSACRSLKLDDGSEVAKANLMKGDEFRFRAIRWVPWFGTMVEEAGQFGAALDVLLDECAKFDRASRFIDQGGRLLTKPKAKLGSDTPYKTCSDKPLTVATVVEALAKGVDLANQGDMNPIQRQKAIKTLTDEGVIVQGSAKVRVAGSGKVGSAVDFDENEMG